MSEPASPAGETLYALLARSGIGTPIEIQQNLKQERVRLDGQRAHAHARVADGARIEVDKFAYRIERSRGGHLLVLPEGEIPRRIGGSHLLQCGYHKCPTPVNGLRAMRPRTLRRYIVRHL